MSQFIYVTITGRIPVRQLSDYDTAEKPCKSVQEAAANLNRWLEDGRFSIEDVVDSMQYDMDTSTGFNVEFEGKDE